MAASCAGKWIALLSTQNTGNHEQGLIGVYLILQIFPVVVKRVHLQTPVSVAVLFKHSCQCISSINHKLCISFPSRSISV